MGRKQDHDDLELPMEDGTELGDALRAEITQAQRALNEIRDQVEAATTVLSRLSGALLRRTVEIKYARQGKEKS